MADAEKPERRFDWIASEACLDFTNTINRPDDHPLREWLQSYDDLVAWALEGGLVDEAAARTLRERAAREPEAAARIHGRAFALREAIYRLCLAAGGQGDVAPADLECLNAELAAALGHVRLRPGKNALVEGWEAGDALDRPLWQVARSAAQLLTRSDLRLHQCAGDNCTYLFADTTKNHRRRWCEMRVCGNLAKVRRHRAKLRAANATGR